MEQVKNILVRWILNSGGNYAIEADVVLENGRIGRASSSSAILAGRRENRVTSDIKGKINQYKENVRVLEKKKYTQDSWDQVLEEYQNVWGTDLTLALSLAYARAASQSEEKGMLGYIRSLLGDCGENMPFAALIPIFSGGVHDLSLGGSMQQIMLVVRENNFAEMVESILTYYSLLEEKMIKDGKLKGYSASSGFLTDNLELEEKFQILSDMIYQHHLEKSMSIAVDVAAEHLKYQQGYHFHHNTLTPSEMEDMLLNLVQKYPITYVEDPFDTYDKRWWESFCQKSSSEVKIFSDDLSATQKKFLDVSIADGVIIKMKQVGTLRGTLQMIKEARKHQILTCVSHRSHETEDTFMCDLGIAVHADYMKIGGPRRGDRVEKYNQLLRLSET